MGTNKYLKLAEKPGLSHPGNPDCEACCVETEFDNGWVCPSCGTYWPAGNLEAGPEDAQLFEEWSGETLDGPTCPNEFAWQVSSFRDSPASRDARVRHFLEKARKSR